jgi:hypothetical protein
LTFQRSLQLHSKLIYLRTQNNQKNEEINQRQKEKEHLFEKIQQLNLKRVHVQKLKQEREEKQKLLSQGSKKVLIIKYDHFTELRVLVESKQKLLPQTKSICDAEISLIANRKLLQECTEELENDENSLRVLDNRILWRRIEFLDKLRSFFIISNSDGKLNINGHRLPNTDFSGCDEEQIATSLGYVAHAAHMISIFTQVPLRYQIVPMCSRSYIRDEITLNSSQKFPLYSKGVDRSRFEFAVYLLNKNIEQVGDCYFLPSLPLKNSC